MLLKNLKEIYRVYLKQLLHLEIPHQKLVICFSGIPGSGKTVLAKKIEERYLGVRINNDDLRKVIAEVMEKYSLPRNEENNQKMLHDSLAHFFFAYQRKNKLIILDSGIERSYQKIFSLLQEKAYSCFVILLDIPLEIVKERLMKREERKPEKNFERLKKWIVDFDSAKKEIKADFVMKENSEEEERKLFQRLDKLILSGKTRRLRFLMRR